MKKAFFKVLALALAVITAFGTLTVNSPAAQYTVVSGISQISANTSSTSNKYSSYWQYWSQGASKYSNVREVGCRVVAQAKLLVESGIVSSNTSSFNPDIYFEWGLNNGVFDSGASETGGHGDSITKYAASVGTNLKYEGRVSLSGTDAEDAATVMGYINKGYYVIVGTPKTTNTSAHQMYVGRAASLKAGKTIILDSWTSWSQSPYTSYDMATGMGLGLNYTYLLYFSVGSHTHNYSTYSHFETAHPHYSVYKCSCGATTTDYTKKNTSESCVQCNPSAFCANLGDEFYGTILNSACWKPISKTEGTDNITLETETGTAKQKWKFERQSDGAYVISSCCDGTVLEMTDGIRENDTQLSAHNDYWGGYYQQWYLIPQGSGVIFLSKHYAEEQWVMNLSENDTSDGNSITIQQRNNTDAQIWNVYQAGDVQLRPADFSVTVYQDIATFKWNAIYGALGYDVKIYNDDVYMNQVDVESGYSIELPAGTYSAYVDSKDYYEYVMSNVVTFTISDKIPEKPVITSVTSDDSGMVTVKWTECERAEYYSLRFYKSGEHYKSLLCVTKDTVYWYELPDGTYTVKVTAEGEDASLNDGCWKDSEMSAEFTVSQKIPDEPAFRTTCAQCGEAFTDADLYNAHVAGHATDNPEYNFTLEIRNPSTTTISYGDAIILHADVTGTLPAGATIKWMASNGNFSCFVSSDGTTCTISPKSSGETTFTATVVDANGNIISSDEQIMTSKAGFFDKIIAFFKGLFGLTKTIPQALKGNF